MILSSSVTEHRCRARAIGPRVAAWAAAFAGLCAAGVAWGESRLEVGQSVVGQPGVVRTLAGTPAVRGTWVVGAAGAYGWQADVFEDDEATKDALHRSWGRLSLAYAPWTFLQVAISLDERVGTYVHEGAGRGNLVAGAVGDPRLSLRTGWRLGRGVSLGGQVGVLFPSGLGVFEAAGGAISPSVDLAVSFTPERFPLGVHLQVGYLHNRTSEVFRGVQDPSDAAMALSGATVAMHHLTLGLAIEYRVGPAAPYVELTGDVPFGARGPEHAWLLVGFGSRFWLGPRDAVQLTAGLEVRALDGGFDPGRDPLVVWESPPLVGAMLGLSVRLPIRRAEPEGPVEGGAGAAGGAGGPGPGEGGGATPAAAGRIIGRVTCADGPCGRGTVVEVVGTGGSPFAVDPEQGTFSTTELAAGTYSVVARGEGLEAQTQQVEVEAGAAAEVSFELESADVVTGIRGRVTDFSGAPLVAQVRIPDLDIEIESNAEGLFEVEAPPGVYQVMIWARGHQTQTTSVEVTRRGMVVMNVELR